MNCLHSKKNIHYPLLIINYVLYLRPLRPTSGETRACCSELKP